MKINEVQLTDKGVDVPYHKELNPLLWEKGKDPSLKSSVRDRLIDIAEMFMEYLDIPEESVLDYVITGSMANYNWTHFSDIDLHLIVDMKELRDSCEGYIDDYLQSKRRLWNDRHHITIYGFEVEVYPEDSSEVHISTGVYSVLNQEWVVEPSYNPPTVDEMSVEFKAQDLMSQIDDLVESNCDSMYLLEEMKDKISTMRKAGLAREGEYSVENIVFKVLRNSGHIKKLFDCYQEALDKSYSIEDDEL